MKTNIDISGLKKADVLAALYNGAKPVGNGELHYHPKPATSAEFQEVLNRVVQSSLLIPGSVPSYYVDWYEGRELKVDLNSDTEFDCFQYDKTNGEGAAQKAVDSLFFYISLLI